MAQSQVPTHNEQSQDEREAKRLFLDCVCLQAQSDVKLTPEESTALMKSVQKAEEQAGMGTENKVFKDIAVRLECIVEEVDGKMDRYIDTDTLDQIIKSDGQKAMGQCFVQVGEHLFRDGITTSRIFVLLRFGYKLVQRFFLNVRKGIDQHLGADVTGFILRVGTFIFNAFLKCRILPWVREHGGWYKVLSSINLGALAIFAGAFLIVLGLWTVTSGATDN